LVIIKKNYGGAMSLKILGPVFVFSALFLFGCDQEKTVQASDSESLFAKSNQVRDQKSLDSLANDTLLLDTLTKDTTSTDSLENDSLKKDTLVLDSIINDTNFIDNLYCSAPALVVDESTLYMQELEGTPVEGILVPGVCGNGLLLSEGESTSLNILLKDSMPVGTVEFWFKPSENFFDGAPKTLLGNDESRVHFFVKDGELIFQKNHADIHYFVKGLLDLDSGWNLIAGQWGNDSLSLAVNGKIIASIPHSYGYVPSTRFSENSNRIVIGEKSSCCMEALSQYESMSTSGAFDQIRISNKIRYEVKVLKADSLYIGNVKDAQINFGLSGDDTFYATSQSSSNMGALVCVTSAAYDNATLMRSLYEFILPDSIVENAIIDSAIFILNIDSWKDKRESTDETFVIHKILSSWNEGTGTSSGCSELGENYNTESINGVTAIERAYGVEWNEVGLGLNDTDASSKVYSSVVIPNHSMEEVAFNVTDLVKEWVETPSSNYGMLLRNLSESSRRFPNIPLFVSGNSTKVDSRPLLKVYYRH
jgi:hypothetical protein